MLYTWPTFIGSHHIVWQGVATYGVGSLAICKSVSFVHTHPNCSGHIRERFSAEDRMVADIPGIDNMWLASPGGNLYIYDTDEAQNQNSPKVTNIYQCPAKLWEPPYWNWEQ